MQTQLRLANWEAGLGDLVVFVSEDGPHACSPEPHFFKKLVDVGLYPIDKQYWDYGLDGDEVSVASHVAEALERVSLHLQEHRCTAIGGICDGTLVAALAASSLVERGRGAAAEAGLKLLINVCSPPPSRLPLLVRRPLDTISTPSVHFLGAQHVALISLPHTTLLLPPVQSFLMCQ